MTNINNPIISSGDVANFEQHMKYFLGWGAMSLRQDLQLVFSGIIRILTSQNSLTLKWREAITKLKEDVNQRCNEYFSSLFGGMQSVSIDSPYIQQFKQQLMALKPIQVLDFDPNQESASGDFQALVNEFKDEIKKGNRASFKLLQELLAKFDELSGDAAQEQKEVFENTVKQNRKKINELIFLAIQGVDSMDLIYQSIMKSDLHKWGPEIEKVIQDYLKVLESHGIEEVKVSGEFFNGETMISIGTVPQSFQTELEQHQVYSVLERGFRDQETGALIREAKVITIN